jgi:hypothetical protein
MSTRVLTDGSAFKEDTLASSSYTTVPGVFEITLPDDYEFNLTEATALDDTVENNVLSIQKARKCMVKIYWDEENSTQQKLRTKAALKTTAIYKVVTTDGTPITYTFTASIVKLGGTVYSPKGVAIKELELLLTTSGMTRA